MKLFKNPIFMFILGALIFTTVGVYATIKIEANEIEYSEGVSVKDKIDDLYNNPATKKFCELKEGTAMTVGAKYECIVGYDTNNNDAEIKKDFYILAINDNQVKLIMDRNITQGSSTTTMTWYNAMKYIDNNNLKTTWSNVLDVDLPKAQDIANAVNNGSWKAAENSDWWCLATRTKDYPNSSPYCNTEQAKAYNWLYDYTSECNGCTHSLGSTEALGYWTRDLISNTANAWNVSMNGNLTYRTVSDSTYYGVRPVITVLKSNLY